VGDGEARVSKVHRFAPSSTTTKPHVILLSHQSSSNNRFPHHQYHFTLCALHPTLSISAIPLTTLDIFNQLNADPTRHFTILESSENNSYPLRSTDTESVASSEDSTTPLLLDSYAAPLIYNTKTRKAAPRSRHRFLPRQFSFGQTPDRQDQTAEEARTLFSAPHESLMCHSDGGNEGSGYEEEWIFPSPSGGNPSKSLSPLTHLLPNPKTMPK
jgi:hypothetical protein